MATLHALVGTAYTSSKDFDQDLALYWLLELDILESERCVGFLEYCDLVSLWESGGHADGLFN